MSRWEKWWQISQSSGFQRPSSEEEAESILKLDPEADRLFPRFSAHKALKFKWKRYVKQYGDPKDGMNVTVFIPIRKSALRRAVKLPFGSFLTAMKEEARKKSILEMPYLDLPLIDTAVKWAVTLFCSRALASVMPVSDLIVTRICYAVQGWNIPYSEGIFPIPFFKDLKAVKRALEEKVSLTEPVSDLSDRICSSFKFEELAVFFKVNPNGEILNIRLRL